MAEGAADLPDKLYFRIGEVAKIVGVKPYVLRFWETEFSMIRPGKAPTNQRLYRRRDVETLLEIKRLLYQERYTIEGAKRRLRAGPGTPAATPPAQSQPASTPMRRLVMPPEIEPSGQMSLPLGERKYREALVRVKQDLEELYEMLCNSGSGD